MALLQNRIPQRILLFLVNFPLFRCHFAIDHLFRQRGKFGSHLLLGTPQKERTDNLLQAFAGILVSFLCYRMDKMFPESVRRTQQTGIDKVELRPQIFQRVFDRCPGQHQAMFTLQTDNRMVCHGSRVLYILAFIQYHIRKTILLQQFDIPPKKPVSNQYNIIPVETLPRFFPLLISHISINTQCAELPDLPFPVRQQRGRHYD